jgi:hypothetical protein
MSHDIKTIEQELTRALAQDYTEFTDAFEIDADEQDKEDYHIKYVVWSSGWDEQDEEYTADTARDKMFGIIATYLDSKGYQYSLDTYNVIGIHNDEQMRLGITIHQ